MPDVVLIAPPIQEFYLTKKRTIPYGLASIAASLEAEGLSCTIIDALARDKVKVIRYPDSFSHLVPYYGRADISLFSLFHQFKHFGYSYEHIGHLTRKAQPLVVGISSLFTPYCDQALETAKAVKRFCPDAIVVLGGHHPTHFPEQTLSWDAVDFVLRGEGEKTFPELCRLLKSQGPNSRPDKACLKQIKGIAFRTGDAMFVTPPAWVEDLGSQPAPDFEKIDWNYYQRRKKATITVVASRGCPFTCSYCAVSAAGSHGRFRQRPVSDILEEIQLQAGKRPIGFIDFEDENLTLKKSWILELLDGIGSIFKGNRVELRAMNGLYPPSLDEEIILAMKKAGFKTLNLSVGSFSKEQLKQFRRPDVRAAHDRVLDMAESFCMDCVSYILGAAPGQSPATSLKDLFMLASRRTLAGFSVYYPAPGSVDYGVCKEKRLLPPDFTMMRSTALPVSDTTSQLQALTLLRLARILNYLKYCAGTQKGLPPALSREALLAMESEGAGAISGPDFSGLCREKASDLLMRMFLTDAVPRGMDHQGNIYVHPHCPDLCKKFVEGIGRIRICPTTA